MRKDLKTLCVELEVAIQSAYEEGIGLPDAEKLATKFLYALVQVSTALKDADLDARMKKAGLKTIKSTVRQEEIGKHEKKPTEGQLEDAVNTHQDVQTVQDALDEAEVSRDLLQNYFVVFKEAQVHFRGIAKGRFE